MKLSRSHVAAFALIVLAFAGACSRTAPGSDEPADPAGFELRVQIQSTNVGPAVGSTVALQKPWTALGHRSLTGEKAAAWLPGAIYAETFDLSPARVGVVPQTVFAVFAMARADWDSLRGRPEGAGIEALARAGGWIVVFRPAGANPYAEGSEDAKTFDRLRLPAAVARTRVQLEVRDGAGLAPVDTTYR